MGEAKRRKLAAQRSQVVKPSLVTAPSRAITASLLAVLSTGVSKAALAQCVNNGFSLTCSGAFNNTNIDLSGGPSQPLSILLNPGVTVTGGGVNAANTTGPSSSFAGVSITANNASVTNTGNSSGDNNTGLRTQSAGDATITASGPIAVIGTASDWAILDIVQNGAAGTSGTAMVTYGQPGAPGAGLNTGDPTAPGGVESGGIQADTRGKGDAIINASGNITGFVGAGLSSFYGLVAHSGDTESTGVGPLPGSAAISYHSGTINITGDFARGMLAWSDGDGSATVTADPGTKIILNSTNQGSAGVYAFASDAMAANGRVVTANVASEIMNFGPANPSLSSKPYGIRAENYGDAPISVTYTGPGITTQGMNGVGIGAGAFGGGSINVSAFGPILTNGSGAFGILAQSAGGPIAVTTLGQGTIATQGPESHGIFASSTTGSVQVNATNVSTTGQFSTAINATSPGPAATGFLPRVATPPNVDTVSVPVITGLSAAGTSGNVTVNVASGGSVMGGWQATPFSLSNPSDPNTVGSRYGLPAAGVILGSASGTATLNNDGSIGALSDLAIVGDPQRH